jgi:hypothetical protein
MITHDVVKKKRASSRVMVFFMRIPDVILELFP